MICKTLCIADLRNVRDNLMKHYRWIWDLNEVVVAQPFTNRTREQNIRHLLK
jgi:hypothetical protein